MICQSVYSSYVETPGWYDFSLLRPRQSYTIDQLALMCKYNAVTYDTLRRFGAPDPMEDELAAYMQFQGLCCSTYVSAIDGEYRYRFHFHVPRCYAIDVHTVYPGESPACALATKTLFIGICVFNAGRNPAHRQSVLTDISRGFARV